MPRAAAMPDSSLASLLLLRAARILSATPARTKLRARIAALFLRPLRSLALLLLWLLVLPPLASLPPAHVALLTPPLSTCCPCR